MIKKLLLLPILIFINFSLLAQEELCPPVALNVFGGSQENIISWGEPIGNIGCGDFPIDEMPYSHQYTNAGNGDNWPVTFAGEDVAYTLNVDQTTTYDFTLCSDFTDYDTKLEIFTNDQDCITPTSTGNYNDDDYTNCPYGYYNAPYPPSGLFGVTLQPGQYYVVVDGYGGATGNYELLVSESGARENYNPIENSIRTVWPSEMIKMEELGVSDEQIDFYTEIVNNPMRYAVQQESSSRDIPAECGSFDTYRIYNASDDVLITSTTELSYTHSQLTNGEEYCYYIKAIYNEGESESTDIMCGTPSDFDPAKPTNVYAEVWDEEVSIYWTDPTILQLGIPYYEDFDEGGLLDLWLVDGENWYWNDFTGSPEPSFQFNWNPTSLNYDQSLYAPAVPLGDLTEVTVSFDMEFSNFDATGAEFLSVEYKTGGQTEWTVLDEFDNAPIVNADGDTTGDGSFSFTPFTYNVTGLTETIQVRFHCFGATTYDINWYYVDNFSVTSDDRESRLEYDFLGYNVYLDGVLNNAAIFDTTGYTVYNLSNEIEYEFGVTSVYEGGEGDENYESIPVTVTAQPIYVYGDVTGFIKDPNGDEIDSVIVSSGSQSDTTGPDGSYTLWNLDVGSNTITARRSGFYSLSEDADILAQADPTLLDMVLSPDMPNPAGLNAEPLDEQVHLSWRTPGDGQELTLQYDDGTLDNAFYFNDTYEDGFAHGTKFDVGGSFDVMAASIYILSEGDEFWPWPNATHGPIRVLVFDDNNGVPGNLLHDEEAVAENGWATVYPEIAGLYGSFYVIATHAPGWADAEGFGVDGSSYGEGAVDYPENMYTFIDGEWSVGDVLNYGGDYMMAAQVMSYGGGRSLETFSSSYNVPNYDNDDIHSSLIASTSALSPANFYNVEPKRPLFNSMNSSTLSRDDLIEYRIYKVDANDNEEFITATNDTFAILDASPNYQTYCYQVTAFWSTDNYGDLESRPSNIDCTVPFTFGDSDFDSDVDISDVLSVVDFTLELDVPTEDEFRNCDVNKDEEINISDIILMVDIIFGTNTRALGFDPNEIAYIDLVSDNDQSELSINIDYNSIVRGLEFELLYNPSLIALNAPSLPIIQDNITLDYSEIKPGQLKVIVANLSGGYIESNNQSYVSIPVEFIGDERDVANISINNSNIAGSDGRLVNLIERTTSSTIQILPVEFALHQNFPNPFNPITEIQFDLPDESKVSLNIYNLMGQKIRTLVSSTYSPGFHSITWDGTNEFGEMVSSGMYFYSIQINSFQATKKMLFLK